VPDLATRMRGADSRRLSAERRLWASGASWPTGSSLFWRAPKSRARRGGLSRAAPSLRAIAGRLGSHPGDCLGYALAPVVTVPVMIPAATANRHKDASLGYEGNCQEQHRDPQIAHRAHLLTESDEQQGACIPE